MFLLFYFHLPWQCSVLYPNSHFLDFTIGKYNLQTEGSHILAKYVLHIYQFSFIERKVRLLFVKVGIRNVRYAVMIAWYFCWYLQCISWCLPLTFSFSSLCGSWSVVITDRTVSFSVDKSECVCFWMRTEAGLIMLTPEHWSHLVIITCQFILIGFFQSLWSNQHINETQHKNQSCRIQQAKINIKKP